jgi:hypothetical protein
MTVSTLAVGPLHAAPNDLHQHTLCFDLTEHRFFVDTGREFCPLGYYLERHPERRGELNYLLSKKLG